MAELGFWNVAQKHPDKLALVTPDEQTFTFGELLASCNQLVHGMRAMGLKKGDTIVFASVGAGMNVNAITYQI